jgi:hypothetical protein
MHCARILRKSEHYRCIPRRVVVTIRLESVPASVVKRIRRSRRASARRSRLQRHRQIQSRSRRARLAVPLLRERCRRIAHHNPSTLLLRDAAAIGARNGVAIEALLLARRNSDGPVLGGRNRALRDGDRDARIEFGVPSVTVPEPETRSSARARPFRPPAA